MVVFLWHGPRKEIPTISRPHLSLILSKTRSSAGNNTRMWWHFLQTGQHLTGFWDVGLQALVRLDWRFRWISQKWTVESWSVVWMQECCGIVKVSGHRVLDGGSNDAEYTPRQVSGSPKGMATSGASDNHVVRVSTWALYRVADIRQTYRKKSLSANGRVLTLECMTLSK